MTSNSSSNHQTDLDLMRLKLDTMTKPEIEKILKFIYENLDMLSDQGTAWVMKMEDTYRRFHNLSVKQLDTLLNIQQQMKAKQTTTLANVSEAMPGMKDEAILQLFPANHFDEH